ncbi:APC family permease [Streptomyces carpinensis]|uniref:APC family permease n=1 Tax=Streptomyces carpinensis TaxID=66369 RepID=A0ABV1VV60_9ACTN|nr:APC family permease [Streptomyces carpinensis]
MKHSSATALAPLAGGLDEEQDELKGNLGVAAIVMIVVAGAAPLGVIASSMPIMLLLTETYILPVYYVLAGAFFILFSVGFVAVSKFVPRAAAFYTYIQAGLGRVPGVASAILTVCSYVVMVASIHVYSGLLISNLVQSYTDLDSPWWAWSLLQVAIIGSIGFRNIDLGVKVLFILVGIEIAFILIMNVFTLVQGGAQGLSARPFHATLIHGDTLGIGVMFAAIGFFGFEAITVFRGESKDPERTVPRATYTALVGVAIFYIFTSWVVVMGTGPDGAIAAALADPEFVIIHQAATFVGAVFGDLLQVLIITSLFACALAFHNVTARCQFNLGKSGVAPKWLGKAHPVLGSPSRSSLVVSVTCLALIAIPLFTGVDPYLDFYVWMSGAGALGIIALMALTSVSIVMFFARTKLDTRVWNSRIAPTLTALALLALLVLVVINFPLLVSGKTAALVIGFAMLGLFGAGLVYGMVLKLKRPEAYAHLGTFAAAHDAGDEQQTAGKKVLR